MANEGTTTIFCAVNAEARPLARAMSLNWTAAAWTGDNVRLIVTGMSRTNLRRAVEREFGKHPPRRVVMLGVAGAADPALRVGDVIVPATAIDLRDGRTFTPDAAWGAATTPHRLGTVDEVACDAAAKTLLRSRHAVDAIDMETAELAAIAQEHDVPWLCIRGISDDAAGSIPRFAVDLTDEVGRPRIGRAAMRIVTGPWRLPALLRLGRDTQRAARAAAQRVVEILEEETRGKRRR